MFDPWKCVLSLEPWALKVLLTAPNHGDLLKAQLPSSPRHPRALLTTLEGLSLWHGHPLRVAVRVDSPCQDSLWSALFGDEWWPSDSPLVELSVEHRDRHVRLPGVGDFRSLRKRQP